MLDLKLSKKGFFSIDALFAIILLILVMGTLVNLYQGRAEVVESSRSKFEGRMISEKLAAAVNSVYATGEPLDLRLKLPDNIVGNNYSIRFIQENRKIAVELLSGSQISDYTGASVVYGEVTVENLDFSEQILVYWENDEIVVGN